MRSSFSALTKIWVTGNPRLKASRVSFSPSAIKHFSLSLPFFSAREAAHFTVSLFLLDIISRIIFILYPSNISKDFKKSRGKGNPQRRMTSCVFFMENFPKPVILRVGPHTNYINITWQPVRKLWDRNTLKQVLPVQHGLSSPVNCLLQSRLWQNHDPVRTLPLWLIPSVGP